jgi:hypothetical protein
MKISANVGFEPTTFAQWRTPQQFINMFFFKEGCFHQSEACQQKQIIEKFLAKQQSRQQNHPKHFSAMLVVIERVV